MKNSISLFLDSGAFSAFTKKIQIDIEEYAAFIKKYERYIEVYANLDVIGDEEATFENQKKMESMGLSPLPTFHQGGKLEYLEHYLNNYDYIALGGMVGVNRNVLSRWLDMVYGNYICDDKGYPKVKTHGFGLTSLKLMLRYPWYSVDSTSWVMTSRFGSVYIPKIRNGKYIYGEDNWKVCVSDRSPSTKEAGKHITSFSPPERRIIKQYFKEKGYKLGKSEFFERPKDYELQEDEKFISKADKNGIREVEKIIEIGLSNDYKLRDEMNIIYFLDLEKFIPEWPWPYKKESMKVFGMR